VDTLGRRRLADIAQLSTFTQAARVRYIPKKLAVVEKH
jgi:hypothetical protein